jgi:hypothetical protein
MLHDDGHLLVQPLKVELWKRCGLKKLLQGDGCVGDWRAGKCEDERKVAVMRAEKADETVRHVDGLAIAGVERWGNLCHLGELAECCQRVEWRRKLRLRRHKVLLGLSPFSECAQKRLTYIRRGLLRLIARSPAHLLDQAMQLRARGQHGIRATSHLGENGQLSGVEALAPRRGPITQGAILPDGSPNFLASAEAAGSSGVHHRLRCHSD